MGSTSTLSGFAARLRGFIEGSMLDWCRTAGRDARLTRRQDACATSKEDFTGLALELFGLQYEHNAPYRRFCEMRGVRPELLEDWREIPAIPTAAFKELELSSLPAEDRPSVFHSSGTTAQERSRHFHNADSLAIYEASLLPWFAANVFRDKLKLELRTQPTPFGVQALACSSEELRTNKKRMLFLTPTSLSAPHSSLVHMFETVRREFGSPESVFVGSVASDGTWTLDWEAALEALRRGVREGRPVIVLGTAFSFVHLLDHLEEQKLHFELPTGSLSLETGGYKSRSRSLPKVELHALIRQSLGISPAHIVCEYGMSELSSQAYDGPVGGEWRGAGGTRRNPPTDFPPPCLPPSYFPATCPDGGRRSVCSGFCSAAGSSLVV